MKTRLIHLISIPLLIILFSQISFADDSAQANNPIANMKAVSLHDYYIGEFTGTEKDGNQFWLRYAQPVSVAETSWLIRASLPVNSYPFGAGGTTETGIGDVNILAANLFDTGSPGVSFGLGPQVNIPTATDDVVGSEKWSTGLANVYFNANSKTFQFGYLLTWAASFAGTDSREDVNLASFQPFLFYQLGGGTYLRSTGVVPYNIETDDYSLPLGLGVGQVFARGKTVYNLFIEPQYSVADEGATWPQWQVFAGFNMQFKGD